MHGQDHLNGFSNRLRIGAPMPYLISALGPQEAGREVQEAHALRPPPAYRPGFPVGSQFAVTDAASWVGRKFDKAATAPDRRRRTVFLAG